MPRPASRPNVLLVIADDHRADAIGALGHPVVRTPTLDGLVRHGTACTRTAIMGSLMPAVCAPARACLLTGRDLFRADAAPALERGPEYEVRLPTEARTLPENFRAAGYRTFFTGKWHNDVPALLRSFEQGETIFHGGMCDHTRVPVRDLADFPAGRPAKIATGFSTEIFCGSAEKFLRAQTGDQPFFAMVALTSPHDPRTPPAEYRALYDPKEIPLPENFLPNHPFDNGELYIRDEQLASHPLDPAVVREHLADYYGMISHHDACLGRVFAALRDIGQADNTIIVYLSDHGLSLGSHGLLGKQNLYNESIRVPVLLQGPGVPAGQRCETLAYGFDLYATLCELGGVAAPTGLASESLVPAFHAVDPAGRETLCAAYMGCQRMVTDGRWKMIVYHVDGLERRQLFDLSSDPAERLDLAGSPEHGTTLSRLHCLLAEWQDDVGDPWMRQSLPYPVS